MLCFMIVSHVTFILYAPIFQQKKYINIYNLSVLSYILLTGSPIIQTCPGRTFGLFSLVSPLVNQSLKKRTDKIYSTLYEGFGVQDAEKTLIL